jgi:hypothetical protein
MLNVLRNREIYAFRDVVLIHNYDFQPAFTAVVVASHGDFSFSSIEQWKL